MEAKLNSLARRKSGLAILELKERRHGRFVRSYSIVTNLMYDQRDKTYKYGKILGLSRNLDEAWLMYMKEVLKEIKAAIPEKKVNSTYDSLVINETTNLSEKEDYQQSNDNDCLDWPDPYRWKNIYCKD